MNYTVQRGDTLSRIASRNGVTVQAIASANGIANVNRIRVGQVLSIPGAAGPVAAPLLSAGVTPGPVTAPVAQAAPIPGTPEWLQRVLGTVPQVAQTVESMKYQRALNDANAERARAGELPARTLNQAAYGTDNPGEPSIPPALLLIGGAAVLLLFLAAGSTPKRK